MGFKVKTLIDAVKANQDVSINTADIQGEFVEQAGHFSYYSEKSAQANRQEAMAKRHRDITYATLDGEYRLAAKEAGEKVTEKGIEGRINLDERYQQAYQAYIDATMIADLLKGKVDAFRNKRDMLIQIGANDRHDSKGSLRLSEKAQDVLDSMSQPDAGNSK